MRGDFYGGIRRGGGGYALDEKSQKGQRGRWDRTDLVWKGGGHTEDRPKKGRGFSPQEGRDAIESGGEVLDRVLGRKSGGGKAGELTKHLRHGLCKKVPGHV